ncbi:MAG: endonuclease/exonuclease/phosphatase family protein, partial [Phycisphaerales bacterium]|nr:endonuclease/exonuclease/phosphatase family protein [Phycisphaerales bacterium]
VPVKLPNGAIVHALCAHPTPPAFDGEEKRNARRNHDEIRFWADYVDRKLWIVDDQGATCGVRWDRPFVILGDLNADPDEGSSFKDPIGTILASVDRINLTPVPTGTPIDGLDDDDTASWGLRVDYVLPSTDLQVRRSGVWRDVPGQGPFPSDHFPVWMDLLVPDPG